MLHRLGGIHPEILLKHGLLARRDLDQPVRKSPHGHSRRARIADRLTDGSIREPEPERLRHRDQAIPATFVSIDLAFGLVLQVEVAGLKIRQHREIQRLIQRKLVVSPPNGHYLLKPRRLTGDGRGESFFHLGQPTSAHGVKKVIPRRKIKIHQRAAEAGTLRDLAEVRRLPTHLRNHLFRRIEDILPALLFLFLPAGTDRITF